MPIIQCFSCHSLVDDSSGICGKCGTSFYVPDPEPEEFPEPEEEGEFIEPEIIEDSGSPEDDPEFPGNPESIEEVPVVDVSEPEVQAIEPATEKSVDQIEYEKAFMIELEIKQRRIELAKNFLELGRLFKVARDEKLYKLLDYESFRAFLANVGFKRATAYSYIHIYELYVLKLQLSPELLVQVPYRMLQMINPVVEENPEEWVHKARELSESDLINEVRVAQGKPEKEYRAPDPDKPKLFDFEDYQSFVRAYGCILHPKREADFAHFPKTKGAGAKDDEGIPLCRECHSEYHGDPIKFQLTYRDQIFGYFYRIIGTAYLALKGEKK